MRQAVQQVRTRLGHSERRICRALGIRRSTVRYVAQPREDDSALTAAVTRLACQYGRYGYRRIHALLRAEGWHVSHSRVSRIWRLEGLKVPHKQPKRSRLWLNDGSCIRLSPRHRNHVWSWDFVFDRTQDGRVLKLMVVMDEYTRRCLAIHVARRIRSKEALEVFEDLMAKHGTPKHIRSEREACPWGAMAPRWWPRTYAAGCTESAHRLPTSLRAARGKMVTVNPSTASFEMNCSMVRSSTR